MVGDINPMALQVVADELSMMAMAKVGIAERIATGTDPGAAVGILDVAGLPEVAGRV